MGTTSCAYIDQSFNVAVGLSAAIPWHPSAQTALDNLIPYLDDTLQAEGGIRGQLITPTISAS